MAQVRQTKTEQRIREALVSLLAERGFDSITVSDLTRRAGIHRGTFYAHYVDKYDLLERQINAVYRNLADILEGDAEKPGNSAGEMGAGSRDFIPYGRVLGALSYIRENYPLIAALTANGTDQRLYERAKQLLGGLVERGAALAGTKLDFGGVPETYGREMMLAGVTSVIWLWIKNGCPEEPRVIAEIIWKNKSRSLEECVLSQRAGA